MTSARVYLVGAGPGDPGLITLRAVECLQQADVVLYDYLANPAVLQHVSDSAELVCLGHHGVGRVFAPDEIVARVLDEVRKGKIGTRLNGGDPSIFGRGVDEVAALRAAEIPFEIVPGITAGLAAAAFCEIPVTHHELASAVAFVTGRERCNKPVTCLDYDGLCRFPGTLIFYMGVKTATSWSAALIEHGKPAETPVAIVRWCSWPRQQMFRCTLGTVVDVLKSQDVRPPAVFVVGEVVNRAPELSWFAQRPLFHTRVLVAESPETPVAIVRWCSWPQQQMFRCTLGTVVDVLKSQDVRPPAVFVVGEVVNRAPELSWFAQRPLFHTRVLVAESPETPNQLPGRLAMLGADVIIQPTLRITDPPDWSPVDAALDHLDQYEWLVFSSEHDVDRLVRRLFQRGGDLRRLGQSRLAAVGSRTADRLRRYYLNADLVVDTFQAERLRPVLANSGTERPWLVTQSNGAPPTLVSVLRESGVCVESIAVSRTTDVDTIDPELVQSIGSGSVDWITIADPKTARYLVRQCGDALRHTRLACLSPITSSALRESGCEPAAEAAEDTTDALLDALVCARQTEE